MYYKRRVLIIFFIINPLTLLDGIASDWRYVTSSKNHDTYVDVESMLIQNNIRKFWVKYIFDSVQSHESAKKLY